MSIMKTETNSKAPRGKTTIEIREIDENTYSVAVNTAAGKVFVRSYGGEKPTVDAVKADFRDERSAFHEV